MSPTTTRYVRAVLDSSAVAFKQDRTNVECSLMHAMVPTVGIESLGPQINPHVVVHKETKEKWKKSSKGIRFQMRHCCGMSKKNEGLVSIMYPLKITEKKLMACAKVTSYYLLGTKLP